MSKPLAFISLQSSAQQSAYYLYHRLFSYAIVYWQIFTVSVIGMVLVAGASAAFPAMMKPMMDGSFVEQDPATIKWIPIILIGIFTVRLMGAFVSSYGMSVIGRNVISQLRKEMFTRLLALPKEFFDQATSGELISKFSFDVEQVANSTTKAITIFIRDALTVIALVAWMFYLDTTLALVFMTVAPMVALLVVSISKRFRKISKNIQESMGSVSRVVEESIKCNMVIKIFGGQDYEQHQFATVNDKNRRQNLRLQMTQALSSPIAQLLVACALALIIYIATSNIDNKISVGTFVSFITAMSMLLPPVRSLTGIVNELQRGIAAAESVFHFIDLSPEKNEGDFQVETVKGSLEFKQLNFSYANTQQALKNINLKILPGQTVAFVGRSGSGKTSLLNLIPRFYDVNEGEVLLDGVNINHYELNNLRQHISYVSQDVVLFNDTIENNIAYGSMKNYKKEQIISATKAAHAYDFIQASTDGFQTMVGERGVMLSGGQRQRIAIARALLNDTPILILDEATSALDSESERYIQASLEKLMENRTTLVIAHRLSTIETADKIICMDNGEIVETGTHQELIKKQGHYARLHKQIIQAH